MEDRDEKEGEKVEDEKEEDGKEVKRRKKRKSRQPGSWGHQKKDSEGSPLFFLSTS